MTSLLSVDIKGARKRGCFYNIGSVYDTETLLICEGFATGSSIYQATQISTVVAFDAGNFEPVISSIRARFPDKQIIICADNDQWKDKNVGVESAKTVANKHNCKFVWPEFTETVCKGKKPTDFNDLHVLQGIEEVKAQLSKVFQTPSRTILPAGFTLSPNGLYFTFQEGKPILISSPLDVLAYTRDEFNENWGRLIKFKDLDGHMHTIAIPMELLKGDCTDFYGLLLSCGLRINPHKRERLKLPEYLQNVQLDKFATCTTRIGWYGNYFVMPDCTIPETDEIYLQSDNSYFSSFRCKGNIPEWQEHIAAPCQGNSRLVFSLSCAFAAPLFHLLHEESGGFNLRGASSIGKSTALAVAASVWGSPKYIQQWKATGNALEAVAEAHNNTLLCLDELGQVNGNEAGEIAYMLANGSGKNRLKAKGGLRKKFEWNLLFLSTGEISIANKINEVGKKAHAGMLTRMVDIPADAGKGHRLFDTIHDFKDGNELANHLKDKVTQHYGSPIRTYLSHLAGLKEGIPSIVDQIRNDFFEQFIKPDAEGQVKRVASRFVVVAAAGELAIKLGILPYEIGEAFEAAGVCFQAWIEERGGTGSYEAEEAIKQVQAFIEAHHSSRFEAMGEENSEPSKDKIMNQAGYKRKTAEGSYEFLIFPQSFDKEICKGIDPNIVKKTLAEQGLLIRDSCGKYTNPVRIPNLKGTKRMILLHPAILVGSE